MLEKCTNIENRGRMLPGILIGITLAAILAVIFYAFNLHHALASLGLWESYQFSFMFAVVDPYSTWQIGPRANAGGMGYPLVELYKHVIEWFGMSLLHVRALNYIYAVVFVVTLTTILRRWFGTIAAIFGVSVTAASIGFVVFANQSIVIMPTLMISALFIERFDAYERNIGSHKIRIVLGILGALLLVHYSMGRFVFVGWILMYVVKTYALAASSCFEADERKAYIRARARSMVVVGGYVLAALAVFNIRNLRHIGQPWEVLFPDAAPEVQMAPADLPQTLLHNISLIFHYLYPAPGQGVSNLVEAAASLNLYPLYNEWHLPLALFGAVIAMKRTFQKTEHGVFPYLNLHILFAITVGLSIFSMINAFPSSRISLSFIPMAGYITVLAASLSELLRRLNRKLDLMLPIAAAMIVFMGGWAISNEFDAMRARFTDRVVVESATGYYKPIPENLPLGIYDEHFLQPRYDDLALQVAKDAPCLLDEASRRGLILDISPMLLLSNGRYPGIHYILYANEMSALMALYLGEHGLPVFYVVPYGANDPGRIDKGHSYNGKPRVFSGPIIWENGQIRYQPIGEIRYKIKAFPRLSPPSIAVVFSSTELDGARAALQERGFPAPEVVSVNSFHDLTPLKLCKFPR